MATDPSMITIHPGMTGVLFFGISHAVALSGPDSAGFPGFLNNLTSKPLAA